MDHYYNGVALPPLPTWDTSRYRFAYITLYPSGNYNLILTAIKMAYYPEYAGSSETYYQCVRTLSTGRYVKYKVVDGAWVLYKAATAYAVIAEYHHSSASSVGSKLIWSDTDVPVGSTSTVYFSASEPSLTPPGLSTLAPTPLLTGWYAGRRMRLHRSQ